MHRFAVITAVLVTNCSLFAGSALGQTLDPVFANSFELGLIGFDPPLSAIAAGANNTATAYTPLQVTLSSPALAPTFVAITSSDPSHITVSGGGATVSTGQTSAAVLVSGLIGSVTANDLMGSIGQYAGCLGACRAGFERN